MSYLRAACSKVKAAIIQQEQNHCKLNGNNNGTYNHEEIMKVELVIKRVLKGIYNDEEDGQGMSNLMDVTTNTINSIQTNKVVTWKAILQQLADEAKETNKIASKRGNILLTILPMITKC